MSLRPSFTAYADLKSGHIDTHFETTAPDTLAFQLATLVRSIEHFSTIELRNSRNEPLHMAVGVTKELGGNAFAHRQDGIHYIGLAFGHFLSSAYFSYQLFFRTPCFADIGTSLPNASGTLELCPQRQFWESRGLGFLDGLAEIETNDTARIKAATFLIHAISSLALYHEFFHATLGHCAVLAEMGFDGRLEEVDSEESSDVPEGISRALERQADARAMSLALGLILSDSDIPTAGGIVDLPVQDRVRLFLVAAGLLTASWHTWQTRTGWHGPTHPASSSRFLDFFNAARDVLKHQARESLFASSAQRALDDLALAAHQSSDLVTAMQLFRRVANAPRVPDIAPHELDGLLEREAFVVLK